MILLPMLLIIVGFGNGPLFAQTDRIDRYLNLEMQKRQIPGLALAVLKNGKVAKMKGYGLANIELNVAVTPSTVFDLASLTKQFTAAAVLLLAEEGKLGVDDSIRQYLPAAPTAWDPITIRHLLTHTSGLKNYYLPQREGTWLFDYKPALIYEAIAKSPPSFPPGHGWAYSNQGYFLLAMIIEKVSGRRYGDFLKERIFSPLGMKATRMLDQWEVVPNRAAGYTLRNRRLAHIRRTSQIEPGGPEGMLSSAEDLAKWGAALQSERLLKKTSLDHILVPAKLNSGLTHGYGFGWFIDEFRGHRFASHSGSTGTQILHFPDDSLSVIVLSNMGDTVESDPWSLARVVAEMYLPELGLGAVTPKSDPNLMRTKRLQETLLDIAQGKMDSSRLTKEAVAGLPPWIPWGIATWVKDIQSFKFIACDDIQHNRVARYGVAVKEVCYYRMVTHGEEEYFWTFYLAADDSVADLSGYRK